LAAAGCRNLDNAQVDVLERELRQQEDYIYELEDYLIEYSEKLRQARLAQCESPAAKAVKPAAPKSPTLDVDPVERPTLPLNGRNKPAPPLSEGPSATPEITPPAAEPMPEAPSPVDPQPEAVDPEEMEVPELEIDPGLGALPWRNDGDVAQTPTLPPVSGESEPLVIPDPVDYQADAEIAAAPLAAVTPEIQPVVETVEEPTLAPPEQNASRLIAERLQIRRVLAEAASEDDASPASLLVVVEALNGTAEPVDAAGEASLMVMTRDAPGSYQKVDRWDFSAEETKAAWQSSRLGDGLHLELPLGGKKLPEGDLELWARLVSADGKKLLTQIPIEPTQLTSMNEALEETEQATGEEQAEGKIAKPRAAETALAASEEGAAAPGWRTSSVPLDPNRVEGFASTATEKGRGWATTSSHRGDPPRAAASSPTGPTWQRSSIPHAESAARRDWTPNR
jgi:hypothetical protein